MKVPTQATLTAPVLRDVWIAQRRLRKGSVASCADLHLEQRDVRKVPHSALFASSCEIAPDAVSLRDIAAADVIRVGDFGRPPDVAVGAPVRVSVATNGIKVTAAGTALTDARVGDQVDVRMQRPPRTLRARVIGPGSVQLLDGSP